MKLHETSHDNTVRYSSIGLLKLRRLCVFIVSEERHCSYFCSFSCPARGDFDRTKGLCVRRGRFVPSSPWGVATPRTWRCFNIDGDKPGGSAVYWCWGIALQKCPNVFEEYFVNISRTSYTSIMYVVRNVLKFY